MAIIRKSEILRRYNAAQTTLLSEADERSWAADRLQKSFESFSSSEHYDIFLSHAYSDARIVMQIRSMLIEKGYSVYVDWIEDKQLDREKVNEHTATVLRNRMNNCSSLIYLTSNSAEKSVWMPWVSIGTLMAPPICGLMEPLKTVIFALKQGGLFLAFSSSSSLITVLT